jgi:DNA-binding transcriptional regulator YiaG
MLGMAPPCGIESITWHFHRLYQVVEKLSRGKNRKVTGAQIRAGRALARLSADELAKLAQVGVMTVRRAESTDEVPNLIPNNMEAIHRALEDAGVEFIDGEMPGVRPRKTKQAKR